MKEERDKFLTEAQGECWHEWGNDPLYKQCVKCRKYLPSADLEKFRSIELTHIDFSTWPGFGKLWEWAIKQEWWEFFWDSLYERAIEEYSIKTNGMKMSRSYFYCIFLTGIFYSERCFINPDIFADAVYKFLKERR